MKKQNIGTVLVFLAALCASINGVLIKLFSWSAMSINSLGNLIGVIVIAAYMVAVKHKFVFNKSGWNGKHNRQGNRQNLREFKLLYGCGRPRKYVDV